MTTAERFHALGGRLQAWSARPGGKRVQQVARWFVTAAVVVYLVARFSEIGWAAILRELPTNGWFYVLFLVLYATLPVVESVIYRLAWGTPF